MNIICWDQWCSVFKQSIMNFFFGLFSSLILHNRFLELSVYGILERLRKCLNEMPLQYLLFLLFHCRKTPWRHSDSPTRRRRHWVTSSTTSSCRFVSASSLPTTIWLHETWRKLEGNCMRESCRKSSEVECHFEFRFKKSSLLRTCFPSRQNR